ncbi:hypothetical protein ACQEU5_16280 [Marinactinospora thermotolerans]|uniref:Uncharacterized protein n=1 Tax=Marinactinospora thermotolerans DSM 45154 TaxID=1122192 RepID=A0A1T4SN33_9ACTN|nr:hypothetical protein [Marinactinospora thermotolerans]SKA29281.1 hypothetical protein SAMN02745673_03689 [Marinactinospora thermotolerans DSM 45154]
MSLDEPIDDRRFFASLRGDPPVVDPMPAEVLAAARAAHAMLCPGELLADVLDDSADTPPEDLRDAVGFGLDPRYLTFGVGDLLLRLEVTSQDSRRDLVGQFDPPRAVSVVVRWPRGRRTEGVDGTGAFVVRGVPGGPVSLLCHLGSGPPVATRWIGV